MYENRMDTYEIFFMKARDNIAADVGKQMVHRLILSWIQVHKPMHYERQHSTERKARDSRTWQIGKT